MSCVGDGGEVGAVEGSDGGGGGGGGKGSGFPVGVPVRVLLVEGDNSTRKIIAALLRKCEYKVVAASDGMEAWNVLREKAHNIDLILTEAELPSLSGFVLLNMITENESCQHIPVIMMSSHDSISMVFKCLLKGAADFLVKPIRKNELRNLWQHVWRRQNTKGSQGVIDAHHNEHLVEQKHETFEKKASNFSSDKVICKKQGQNSKKDSDAESSCTRSEMEVESTYMQNIQEVTHERVMDVSLSDNNAEKCKASRNAEIMVQDDAEDNLTMFDSQLSLSNKVCDSMVVSKEKEKPEVVAADGQTAYHRTTQVINLIGAIDNQHHHNHEIKSRVVSSHGFSYPAQSTVHCVNSESVTRPSPHLELSLRRYHHPSFYQKGKDENGALNHSNSSAFSLYNSKTDLPSSRTQRNLSTEDNNSLAADTQEKDSCNITSFSHENDSASHENQEHDMLATSQTLPQNGAAIPPPPVIPIPVPIIWQPSSQVLQPIFYPSQALWNPVPSVWQETAHRSASNHYDPGGFTDQHVTNKLQSSQDLPQNVLKNMEPGKQQRRVSSSGRLLDCSVSGGIYIENEKDTDHPSICKSHVENASDLSVPAEEALQHTMIDQREAALAKFRLKRKDRCYEKKVRYESRKKLAEQRPRVKGQFVRQAQQIGSTNI